MIPTEDSIRLPDASADVADREWVLAELGRLDIDQRSVIALHYYLDLPMREVAAILGIPFGTAASRLHRGLEVMRAAMREHPAAAIAPGHGANGMNDERSFERFVADNVAGAAGSVRLPDDFYDDIHAFASRTRQRPEWLALIKEPPMRHHPVSSSGRRSPASRPSRSPRCSWPCSASERSSRVPSRLPPPRPQQRLRRSSPATHP